MRGPKYLYKQIFANINLLIKILNPNLPVFLLCEIIQSNYGRKRFINQSNGGSAKMSDIRKILQKKRRVNAVLRKESPNMSIECKTFFLSVWDAVMKLTAVGKYHFSSDIRMFKNIKLPPPLSPIFFIAYNL